MFVKILKKIFFVLITLVALVLIVALFVNGEYAVQKTVDVNKPKDEVFNYLRHLKNQDDYSAWNRIDPNMKKTYKGTDGEVGFVSAWESKDENVGVGEQEIMKIDDGKRIDVELRFKVPFEATDQAYFTTESINDDKTKVSWGFEGKMNYPMNLMMLFMDMEEMLGPQLQEGLDKAKEIMESTEE